eukprot:Nk52_evm23s503 gene=Nk52_evmTU23s503
MGELTDEIGPLKPSDHALSEQEVVDFKRTDVSTSKTKSVSLEYLQSDTEDSGVDKVSHCKSASVAYHWINIFGYGPYQHKRMVLPVLGAFCDGLEIFLAGLLSYDLSREKQWDLDGDDFSQLASSAFVGMMIGSIVFGILSDKFGRRPVFIAVSFLLFASSLSTAFSNSFAMLVGLRALTGFFMGGQLPISITMAREICPDKNWAILNAFILAFFAGGSFYCAFVGYMCLDSLGWRYFLVFCAIPPAIQSVLTLFYPESVRYHEVKGDFAALQKALLQVAKENNASPGHYGLLEQDCQTAQEEYDNWELVVAQQKSFLDKCTEIRHLFNASNIRITIVLAIGWFVCSLNMYGLNFYLQVILKMHGFASSSIYKTTMLNASATILGSICAFPAIRFIGYGATITFGLIIAAGFSIGFGLSSEYGAIIITCWFLECFLQLLFTTFYALTPLTYHSCLRATAMGVCGASTRIAGIAVPYIFNALLTSSTDSIIIPYGMLAGIDVFVAMLIFFVLKTRDQGRFMEV